MITEKNGNLFDTDRLEQRIHVFKNVCLPSILNQTWKNFFWVILVDSQLPEQYLSQLLSIANKHKFIKILPWKPDTYKLAKIDWLKDANININVNHIITTRLDDDDALHPNFALTVQTYYKQQGYKIRHIRFLTFPSGIIWLKNTNKNGMMNPFMMDFIALGMTLIVNSKTYPVNVYGFNHAKLKYSYKMRFKNDPYIYKWLSNKLGRTITYRHFLLRDAMLSIKTTFPMYIYTIHGHNDSAEKYYKRLFRNGGAFTPVDIMRILKQFHIKK